jgi:hypothetical protein
MSPTLPLRQRVFVVSASQRLTRSLTTPIPQNSSLIFWSNISVSSRTIAPLSSLFAISTPHSVLVGATQRRHATLLRRPKRPYTFTQLVTLSDGSTYIHRTTSPAPVYRSTRDTRNTLLWNPSSQKLLTVEEDEAGRLAAFRARYGRAWDASSSATATAAAAVSPGVGEKSSDTSPAAAVGVDGKLEVGAEVGAGGETTSSHTADAALLDAEMQEEDLLLDLITSYGQEPTDQTSPSSAKKKEDKKK